jgi:hypothetical protein
MVTLDLRHVASPAVRDLLHLVNHSDSTARNSRSNASAAAPSPCA